MIGVVVVVVANIFVADGKEAVASLIIPQIPEVTSSVLRKYAAVEAVAAAATPAASVPAKAPLAAPPIDEAGPPFVVWIFGRLKDGEILAIFGNSAACLLKPDAILLILMFMEPLAMLTGKTLPASMSSFLAVCNGCNGT